MATVSEKEYLSQLHQIQCENPPSIALLPTAETIYDIDLSTRRISSPKFLSVSKDHKSETIYFRVDRFFDYMDLSNTTCVIQYYTSDGKPRVYQVPFYDVYTESDKDKMLIPWCIDGAATAKSGKIQYSFRFFLTDYVDGQYKLIYNLNTLPATSQVLVGMDVIGHHSQEFDIPADSFHVLMDEVNKLKQRDGVFWTFVNTPEDLERLSIDIDVV